MQTVNYSDKIDQFYYDGYQAFSPEKDEEENEFIPGVFLNGKPVKRERN